MHITSSAPKIAKFISQRALSTASLVAAVTPTLPVASLNSSLSLLPVLANSFTCATRPAMVSPCWSVVFTSTCIALQSGFRRPVEVSIGVTDCAITCGSRGSWRHLTLPSLKPAFTTLAMPGSEITDLRPRHVLHEPVEALDGGSSRRTGARALHVLGLRDDPHRVHADRELLHDLRVVEVVARLPGAAPARRCRSRRP
jgi:hypothetical protein